MGEKITSIRINEEIWKKAKILAIIEGITLKSLIEDALITVIEGDEIARKFKRTAKRGVLEKLKEARRRGLLPFQIISEKTAVELVKEGRGD
ncbi:MAG: hypothetical protein ACTSVA_04105 [Candidatus Njordarchaeales archaeon]